nr:ribonuclease H-like domain-containing protein [Tanacetum cinerariifolium]
MFYLRAKGNQDSRIRDVGYNGNKTRDNGRRRVYQDDSKALVTIDEEDIKWSRHVKEDAQNYAMMAYSSSNSCSYNEVFFLANKDETCGILKSFVTGIENLVDHKVKLIRCDDETEFKTKEMNQFCKMKGILRQFSVARTPQQNGVAKRRNRTLIKVARTMLADSKLTTTFWAKAVNTACYVQNRVLVVKPHNKTPYDVFHGRTPTLSFMGPFGCLVTILNIIDHLGKFNSKVDEGFYVGYSLNIKAFRVFNSRTRIVEENLHTSFSEGTPNVVGESLEKEITKKQKIDEEEEELKSHLQIVSNDDDDVYTQATPLALKIPIVDYKIHLERNKPYFKIIRADDNHMLFLSFSTLLKNFDREDLESL